MLKYLKELCALPGPSGFEEPVRNFIIKKAEKCADDLRTDALGNLIIHKKGKYHPEKKILLTAHMDEVGFIITKVEDSGFLRVAPLGGIDPRVVLGRKVFCGEAKVPGIIGLKAVHLVSKEERAQVPKISDMYVDIGEKDKASAEKKVTAGDFAVFEESFSSLGNYGIKGKALDDRVGCAIMLGIIEKPLPVDLTFVFSVQEEVGCRGAFGAAFSEKPDIALILEGTTSADIPSVEAQKRVTFAGKGPVIGFMDAGTIYDRDLFELLRSLAEENKIPWQIKEYIAGGTDAQALQRSGKGVRTSSISVPVKYIHSPSSVADKRDIENAMKLTELFIEAAKDF